MKNGTNGNPKLTKISFACSFCQNEFVFWRCFLRILARKSAVVKGFSWFPSASPVIFQDNTTTALFQISLPTI
jgi:hypothetical protein